MTDTSDLIARLRSRIQRSVFVHHESVSVPIDDLRQLADALASLEARKGEFERERDETREAYGKAWNAEADKHNAALASARDEGLEAAAKVAEELTIVWSSQSPNGWSINDTTAMLTACRIRALKAPAPPAVEGE